MSSAKMIAAYERKEPRYPAVITVRAFLQENDGFGSLACTYEISRHGARVTKIAGMERIDQCLWLQRQDRKAKYRVSWMGTPGSVLEDQIGLELMEPETVIWEATVLGPFNLA